MKEITTKENKMGTQPIPKLLITMSLPMMLSMLTLALYNIVDSIFVAQISQNALTGVSLAFPFQMLIVGIGVGTGVGTNSLIARKLGEKQNEYANRAGANGMFLAVVSSLVLSVVFLLLSRTLMSLFSDDSDIIEQATIYLRICGGLCMASVVATVCEKILQATGNMLHPMLIQLAGAITNIVFDPIFIFGYFGVKPMGIAGAAYATVLGQVVSMLIGIYFLFFYKKNDILHIRFRRFKPDSKIIFGIYEVGIASILMQSVMSFTTLVLNSILISFSSIAVNVLGVYFKVQSFIFMPVFGLTSGALPILAYNYGAKNKYRFIKTLKTTLFYAFAIMILGFIFMQAFPTQLLGLFNADEEMLQIGIKAFRTISFSFPLAAITIVFITTFNSIGRGVFSLIITLMRQVVVILPVAYFFSKLFGLSYIWLAYPIAEVVGFTTASVFMLISYKTYVKHLVPAGEVS
ncbi:MAG TPA: MATE family efflux transporter [Clostridiales bacterium]|jgi:putative MATE family efflux protein|nr:MATE family efflux transporter [Clostridiales bacterium]